MIQLHNKQPLFPPKDLIPRKKTLKDLPQREFLIRGCKIFMIGRLAWDYTSTVLEVAATLNLPDETKKIARSIRELKMDYDRRHARSLTDAEISEESDLALKFEDFCQRHFDKLSLGLGNDKFVAGVKRDHKILIKAVQMALTVIDALKIYSAKYDSWIRDQGVHTGVNPTIPTHFIKLSKLLPLYAGDCYNPDSEARRITARILYNELEHIELYDDKGAI